MLKTNENAQYYKNKVQIIAHRGLSSIFPENTLQSITAALHCSDLVELDVQLTQDNEVIVFHDRGLKRLTNIKKFPQYQARFKSQSIQNQGKPQLNWWIRDFTYNELKQLRVFQPVAHRPQLPHIFRISKLEQIIQQCLNQINRNKNKGEIKSGLLIQLKSEIDKKTTERDYVLCQKLIDILAKFNLHTVKGCKSSNFQIILQSFNLDMLKFLLPYTQNQFIQLYKKDVVINYELLNKNKEARVKGIGVTEQGLNMHAKESMKLKEICNKLGYSLYYWTIKDDDDKIPFGCRSYTEVYKLLYQSGVTGFITQFPNKAKGSLEIQSTQFETSKQEKAQKCPRQSHKNEEQQLNEIEKLKNKETQCSEAEIKV